MERGVDEHRFLGDIDLVADKLPDHRREVLVKVPNALDDLNERRIQPDGPAAARSLDAVVPLQTFADEGGAFDIAGLPGEDEQLTVLIERLTTGSFP
jgi:hypothetical protein